MPWRRFATDRRRTREGSAVTFINRCVIAFIAAAVAATLSGCGTAPRPLSVEEALWFDKAQSYDIIPVRPDPTYAPYGYRRW